MKAISESSRPDVELILGGTTLLTPDDMFELMLGSQAQPSMLKRPILTSRGGAQGIRIEVPSNLDYLPSALYQNFQFLVEQYVNSMKSVVDTTTRSGSQQLMNILGHPLSQAADVPTIFHQFAAPAITAFAVILRKCTYCWSYASQMREGGRPWKANLKVRGWHSTILESQVVANKILN